MTRRFSDRPVPCCGCERPIRARSPIVMLDGQDFHALCARFHLDDLEAVGQLAEKAENNEAWRIFTKLEGVV